MKKLICFLLCLLLLCGCSSGKNRDNTVFFYYCQASTENSLSETVVTAEQREVSADPTDLKNILSLYLIGPLDEELSSPFRGMKLVSVEKEDSLLLVELSCNDRSLTDIRFSLACACITMTCLELTEAEQVSISCADRSATMTRETILVTDTVTHLEPPREETP